MSTRKQQKRRAKRMVHGTPIDEEHSERRPARTRAPRAQEPPAKGRGRGRGLGLRGGQRALPEASWRRSIKRAAIFLPVIVGLFYIASEERSVATIVIPALLATALFVPVDFWTAKMTQRMVQKRGAKRG